MEHVPAYRLLLVEDSEEQQLVMDHLLHQIQTEHYEVSLASSYAEALQLLQEQSYDAILADYYLDTPHTALNLIQEVRLMNLPVVVITADEDRSVFLECFQRGAKEFLNKPINLIEMQIRLRSVLHARNYESSLLEEIQERRRIEAQLRQQERMNRILLDAAPHLILRFDQNNLLLDFKNDSDGTLKEVEIRGKRLSDLPLPKNLLEQLEQLTQLVRNSNTDEEFSYSARNESFELTRYELQGYPGENNEVIIFLRSFGEQDEFTVISADNLTLNVSTKEVRRSSQPIYLNRKEYRLLQYFMKNPNRVLSKDMILHTVWGYNFEPEARVVDTLIARLRKKIDHGFTPQFIQTERGVGYSFKTSDWRKSRPPAVSIAT